jgi:hypothetical protein
MDNLSKNQNVRPLRRAEKSPLDRRWATSWHGELRTSSRLLPSVVEDVSADGAKLRVGSIPIDGEKVTLILPNCSPIEARIAWRRREHIGIQFSTRQSWIIELVLQVAEGEEWFPVTVA